MREGGEKMKKIYNKWCKNCKEKNRTYCVPCTLNTLREQLLVEKPLLFKKRVKEAGK